MAKRPICGQSRAMLTTVTGRLRLDHSEHLNMAIYTKRPISYWNRARSTGRQSDRGKVGPTASPPGPSPPTRQGLQRTRWASSGTLVAAAAGLRALLQQLQQQHPHGHLGARELPATLAIPRRVFELRRDVGR